MLAQVTVFSHLSVSALTTCSSTLRCVSAPGTVALSGGVGNNALHNRQDNPKGTTGIHSTMGTLL